MAVADKKRSSYPYPYSVGVVTAFVENYARATIFLAKMLDLPYSELKYRLTLLFMHHNPRWNRMRDFIKDVERLDLYANMRGYTAAELQDYLTDDVYLGKETNFFEK